MAGSAGLRVGQGLRGCVVGASSFPIGVLFGCFGRYIDGPGLPGGLIIYQGHLFPLKGHLWFPQFCWWFGAWNPTTYAGLQKKKKDLHLEPPFETCCFFQHQNRVGNHRLQVAMLRCIMHPDPCQNCHCFFLQPRLGLAGPHREAAGATAAEAAPRAPGEANRTRRKAGWTRVGAMGEIDGLGIRGGGRFLWVPVLCACGV